MSDNVAYDIFNARLIATSNILAAMIGPLANKQCHKRITTPDLYSALSEAVGIVHKLEKQLSEVDK